MSHLVACLARWTVAACLVAAMTGACHLALTIGLVPPVFAQGQEPPPTNTTLPLRLVGVAVDPQTPSNSACLVQCTYHDGKLGRFQVGQQACAVAEVTGIRSDGITITNLLTKRSELLAFADTGSAPDPASPPPAPTITASAGTVDVDLAKGAVDYYLGNLGDILASATATPKFRDGSNGTVVEGFELTKIRNGSIVEQLGLHDGDVLVDVNGQPLDSVPNVLRLLGEVRGTSQVKMTVLRNGQKLTFVLNSK